MKDNGFTDEHTKAAEIEHKLKWNNATIAELNLPNAVTVPGSTTCLSAVEVMQKHGFDQLPVINPVTGKLIGLVTLGHLLSKISSGRATPDLFVDKVMFRVQIRDKKKFLMITSTTKLESLNEFFEKNSAACVMDGEKVTSVVTKVDLVSYLMRRKSLY